MNTAPNQQKPVWARDRQQSLKNRIEKIQTLNDPTTSVDEILLYSKFILYVLLAYSAVLGFFCYYKNFSQSFPYYAALFMSLALPLAIEFGKNYCATWAIRKPFFNGFGPICEKWSSLIMFIALTVVGIVTFIMSVRNSTVGAEQLSQMLSHERNKTVFTPNTADIDAQIDATQQSINENRGIKWKGVVTYQAQKAIQSQTAALDKLQAQRETAMQQQRADWEKETAHKESQGNYVAELVLASGGWTEVLQFLLMFLRVACEKSLDNRMTQRYPTPQEIQQPVPQNYVQNNTPIRYYFNRNADGNVQSAMPTPHSVFPPDDDPENTVSQPPFTVSQQSDTQTANAADDVLRLAETNLRRHHANFGRKQGRDATTSESINAILEETYQKVVQPGFNPSRAAALRFYNYLVNLLTSLDEKGRPYERSTAMARYCLEMIPEPAT